MEIIDTHVHLNDDESFRYTIDLEQSAGVARMVVSRLAPYDGICKPTPEQFRADNARVDEWMKREAGFVKPGSIEKQGVPV